MLSMYSRSNSRSFSSRLANEFYGYNEGLKLCTDPLTVDSAFFVYELDRHGSSAPPPSDVHERNDPTEPYAVA